MILHYNIFVKGKVQGVWFRKYTQQAANSHDLRGFVQNKMDGTVYIEAEGEETNLKLLIKWLGKGSPLSEVKDVNVSEGDLVGFNGFDTIR
jgi:acylphosphatase